VVRLSSQVVYQTNADWHASSEALFHNPLLKTFSESDKGLLIFQFIDSPTIFILAPTGKLQVKWKDIEEKKILFRLIKNLLVAPPNEQLIIKPLKQQLWIEYPVPDPFKVYWCDQSSEFALKKPIVPAKEEAPSKFSIELGRVRQALGELRHELRFLREPSFNEVAIKSCCLNHDTIRIALKLSIWRDEPLDQAKRTAEETLNLASWINYKNGSEENPKLMALSRKAINSASLEAIKRAQVILKNYPELIPKVGSNQLMWPEETKAKWVAVFADEPPAPQTWK
jgi:hypothetical protein